MKTPSIAIDLGGTIEDSWASKQRWFAARGLEIGPWSRSRMEIVRMVGGHESLYERMTAEVYSDENVLAREPVEGVAAALNTMAQRFRIVIVSSRREAQRTTTLRWLERHDLVGAVDEIAFLGPHANKLAWCLGARVAVLIDDDLRHLAPADRSHAVVRIHLCARPTDPRGAHHEIRAASGWPAVLNILQDVESESSRAD
jgi:uncharacterized HAD superfamily protein